MALVGLEKGCVESVEWNGGMEHWNGFESFLKPLP